MDVGRRYAMIGAPDAIRLRLQAHGHYVPGAGTVRPPPGLRLQAHGHYVPGAGTVTRPWRASLLPNPSPWALRARGGNRHSALAGRAPPKSKPMGTTCPGRNRHSALAGLAPPKSKPMGTTCPGREPSLGPGGPRSSQTQAHGHYVPGAGTVTRPWRASLLPNPSPWALRARGGNRHSALAGLAPPKPKPMGTSCPGREPSLGPGGPRSSQIQAHGHFVPGAGTVTRPWRASLLPNPSPWALRARGGI